MRISDWSSDVCSSDLERDVVEGGDSGAAGSGKALADPVETDDRPRRAARLRRRNARGGIRWRWGGRPAPGLGNGRRHTNIAVQAIGRRATYVGVHPGREPRFSRTFTWPAPQFIQSSLT